MRVGDVGRGDAARGVHQVRHNCCRVIARVGVRHRRCRRSLHLEGLRRNRSGVGIAEGCGFALLQAAHGAGDLVRCDCAGGFRLCHGAEDGHRRARVGERELDDHSCVRCGRAEVLDRCGVGRGRGNAHVRGCCELDLQVGARGAGQHGCGTQEQGGACGCGKECCAHVEKRKKVRTIFACLNAAVNARVARCEQASL